MKIAILDLTTHPEPMLSGMPRVGEQIEDWLSPAFLEAEFRLVSVAEDDEPLPAVAVFDGLLVSGSEYGVYEDLTWMQPLRQLLLETREAGKPIYGICFGHQIMADTFGGKAEKSAGGNVVGARTFQFDHRAVDANVWHQDQVTKVPPGSRITASAAHCPVGALAYDFPAASIQFHPEYTQPHLREIFRRGRDVLLPGDQADEAMKSFEESDVAIDLMAAEVADFYREHGKKS
ncbi:MAG: type 1 glutamine amidotransferase [Rhizobiaceae bacterium]